MIIDFFTKVDYNTHALNFKYEQYAIDTALYENLRDSSHARFHQIDYRSVPNMEPLDNLYNYLEQAQTNRIRVSLRIIHSYLPNIKTLLDVKNFKKTFPVLLKQYRKINKVLLLIDLFKEFFDHIYKEVECLQNDITNYYLLKYTNNRIKGDKKRMKELRIKIYRNRLLHDNFVVHILSRFMDIYSIGRLLKPGYNYCVMYAGAFHTIDVLKTLQKHGYLFPKEPSFIETTYAEANEMLDNCDRIIIGDDCIPL